MTNYKLGMLRCGGQKIGGERISYLPLELFWGFFSSIFNTFRVLMAYYHGTQATKWETLSLPRRPR